MQEKLLHTRREAAEMLSISLRQLDYLLAAGQLPARRIGRRRLISKKSLDSFARGDHVSLQKKHAQKLEVNTGTGATSAK